MQSGIKMAMFIHTCMSLAGFQSISKRTSLEAPIRFNPTPPALELNRNTTVPQKKRETCRQWVYEINQCITEQLSYWKAWRQCIQKPFSTFIRLLAICCSLKFRQGLWGEMFQTSKDWDETWAQPQPLSSIPPLCVRVHGQTLVWP